MNSPQSPDNDQSKHLAEDKEAGAEFVAESKMSSPRWSNAELKRVARIYDLMIKIDQRNKRKLAVKSDKKKRKIIG